MFCPKCGTQNEDNATFCRKCGNQFTSKSTTKNTSISKKATNFSKTHLIVLGGGCLAILLLVIVIAIIQKPDNQNTIITAQKDVQTQEEPSIDRTVSSIEEASANLSGEYPNLTFIKALGGDVRLDGSFPALTSIEMTEGNTEGVGDLYITSGTTLPQVTSLQCAIIYLDNSADYTTDELENIFPNLKQICLVERLEDMGDDFDALAWHASAMYDDGCVTSTDLHIYHDIDDLYGIWSSENGMLTLQFNNDGTVQITDPTGTIGMNVCTCTQKDDHTLTLQPKTSSGLVNNFSLDMEYIIYKDTLKVTIYGSSYKLTRN